MDVALLICRLALAGVFVLAALAKAVDLSRARQAFEQLGVPRAVVPVAVILAPLAELAVAVALIPAATATVAAVAAAVLLAAFTVLVAVAVGRGTEAECHCFGNVSSRPVGIGTLVRNGVLLALASFVAARGAGTSATAWAADLSTPEAVLGGVSVLLALSVTFNAAFLFQLFRQHGRLVAEIEELRSSVPAEPQGLQVGEYAPSFELPDLAGELTELDDLLDGDRGLVLLFTSPDCGACDPLLPAVGRRQRAPGDGPGVVLISLGERDSVAAKASEHGIEGVLLIEDFELPHLLGVSGSPGAVVLDAEGRLAAKAVLGTGAVAELIGHDSAPPELVRVEGTA